MKQVLMFFFVILLVWHPISAEVSQGLKVKGKNNETYNVGGYSSYRNYASRVEELLTHKIQDTYSFALQFSTTNAAGLLSRTTPDKLVFLQFLHSCHIKDTSYNTFLFSVSKLFRFTPSRDFKKWIEDNFSFPPEKIYDIIGVVAKENVPLPQEVIDQLFFLNSNYKTLEKAIEKQDTDVVEWILSHGTWKDKPLDTEILIDAWKSGRIGVVKLLLKYIERTKLNIPQNAVNELHKNNETLLHLASRSGYVGAVTLLTSNSAADVNKNDTFGKSSLYRAVESDKSEVVEVLFSKGANFNKEPLLAAAVKKGNLKTVTVLVKLGVPLDMKDENGDTPLFLAVEENKVKILEALADVSEPKKALLNSTNDFGDTLLHVAASKGHVETVKALKSLGVVIDFRNNYGETPLYKAVEAQNLEIVNILIDSGADIKAQTDLGDTLLHLAASKGNKPIVELLISKRFLLPINLQNSIGQTPLYKAAQSGKCFMLKLLVQHGGDMNLKNDGMTMLHLAAMEGNEKAVNCLVDSGMNVDETGLWDVTPLHLAVSQGSEKVIRKLLEKKANPNARTKDLWTPLHRAAVTGKLNVIKLLISFTADVNAQNVAGDTPHTLAIKYLQTPAAALLNSYMVQPDREITF